MYGSGNGIGPIAGGGGGATVLAFTGTGSMVLPLVVAGVVLVLGVLLAVRGRLLARTAQMA